MGEYLDWKVGDEVVCLHTFKEIYHGETGPVEGGIYHIRNFEVDGEGVCIRLVEIVNPLICGFDGKEEAAFVASAFRKVQKHKTDISVFKAMLNKTPAQNKKELETCHG